MKIHSVNMLIALATSALITVVIVGSDNDVMRVTRGIGSLVTLASTLGLALGLSFQDSRIGINLRLVGFLFFVLMLGWALLSAWLDVSQTTYIVTSGVTLMMFVMIANAIFSTRMPAPR